MRARYFLVQSRWRCAILEVARFDKPLLQSFAVYCGFGACNSPMVCVVETGNAKMEAANQRGASLSLLTRWFAHARPAQYVSFAISSLFSSTSVNFVCDANRKFLGNCPHKRPFLGAARVLRSRKCQICPSGFEFSL